jgi:hypothetical protein
MTNKEKATNIMAIIMDELNMPKGSTIGDVAIALSSIDPDGEIMKIFKIYMTKAIVEEIQKKIA